MYKKAYQAVLHQATEEVRVAEDEHVFLTPIDLVISLRSNPTNLRVNTLQLRRSALLWEFRKINPPGAEEAIQELLQWRPEKDLPVLVPFDRKTRAPRRMISKEDLETLSLQLMKMKGWADRARYMLLSGVICGNRPIEWICTYLVYPDVVRIRSAKKKYKNSWDSIPQEASSGIESEYEEGNLQRQLSQAQLALEKDQKLFEDLKKNRIDDTVAIFRDVRINVVDVSMVAMNLASIRTFMTEKVGPDYDELPQEELEDAFRKFYIEPIRKVILRACKRAFSDKRTYGLADARSAFAANRKRQNGLEQTAVDMGHSGTTTTRGSYAPGRLGWAKKALGEQNKNAQVEQMRAENGPSPDSEADQGESEAPSQ